MATVAIKNEIKPKLDEYCFKHKRKQIDVVTKSVEKYMRKNK